MTERLLSAKEVAERIGLRPGTLSRYPLPKPDVLVGTTRGWRADTIDRWAATRVKRKTGSHATEEFSLVWQNDYELYHAIVEHARRYLRNENGAAPSDIGESVIAYLHSQLMWHTEDSAPPSLRALVTVELDDVDASEVGADVLDAVENEGYDRRTGYVK